jgi:small-conductance mechanosensitive channel
MENMINIDALLAKALSFLEQVQALLMQPALWLQFAVIAAVFVVARWILAPLLKRLLDSLTERTARVPSFRRVWSALSQHRNTIAWLMLQWLAIKISSQFGWAQGLLITVASLLTAWVLINLASTLIENRGVARVLAALAWTFAALNIFGLLDPTMEILDSWAVQVGQLRLSPLTVVKVGLSLWFALWLANGIAGMVERRMARSQGSSATTRVLVSKLTRISLVTLAILVALSAVGIDLTALAVFSGALGVGLGFGLQKIFSNLVSGLILLMDRSIKPGDVISLGPTYGWVNHLGLRYTSVITRDAIEHLIPNEELIVQRVENWSFSDSLVRLRIPVGISYDSDVRLAMKLCLESAAQIARVQKNPEPRINVTGFGDSSVNLELRVWINDPQQGRGSVISDVLLVIWDKFHEHGIQIPFPQRDLHLKSVLGEQEVSALRGALKNNETS